MSDYKEFLEKTLYEASSNTLWNLEVKKDGKWSRGNQKPMNFKDAEQMMKDFENAKISSITDIKLVGVLKENKEFLEDTINEEVISEAISMDSIKKAKAMFKSLSKDLQKKVSQIDDMLKKDDKFWVSQWGTLSALPKDIQRNLKGFIDSSSRLSK